MAPERPIGRTRGGEIGIENRLRRTLSRNPPRGPINLKESWRLADIHSQVSSVKVPHGNPSRSNLQRTSKQIRLRKNILIISVSYDLCSTLSSNILYISEHEWAELFDSPPVAGRAREAYS